MARTITFHLIGFHVTLVYYDVSEPRLRHAPLGTRPPVNLRVVKSGDTYCMEVLEGVWRNISPSDVGGGTELNVELYENGTLSLRSGGRYFCAEPGGGRAAFDRERAQAWELFVPVEPLDLETLLAIMSARWLCRGRRKLLTAGAGDAHTINIGDFNATIPAFCTVVRALHPGGFPPGTLKLQNGDDWRIEHLQLFRPVVYLAASGKADQFDCAEMAVTSLFEAGAYEGDVLLITDAAHADFYTRFPAPLRSRIGTVVMSAQDVLDYTLARYRVVESAAMAGYQPLLYLDTDIICDAPIEGLLTRALLAGDVQFCLELPLATGIGFYGQWLLEADHIPLAPDERGYTSGIFILPSAEQARETCRTIVAATEAYARQVSSRSFSNVYDQPFFNYVLRKFGAGDGALLTPCVETYGPERSELEKVVGRGFVHFAGGVGNTEPKAMHMRRYLALLSEHTRSPGR